MSGREEREEVRLLNIVVALLVGDSKKLNLAKDVRVRAAEFGIARLSSIIADIASEQEAVIVAKPVHHIDSAVAVHSRKKIAAIHETLKPECAKIAAAKRKSREVRLREADERYAQSAAGIARFASLWDDVKISGKSVGDIWYHELDHYGEAGTFEAELCRQLKGVAIPNEPTRCRNLTNAENFSEMVRRAEQVKRQWRAA